MIIYILWPYIFAGSLPLTLFSISTLKYIKSSNNTFSGALPREIANATSLRYFFLEENALTGMVVSAHRPLSLLLHVWEIFIYYDNEKLI